MRWYCAEVAGGHSPHGLDSDWAQDPGTRARRPFFCFLFFFLPFVILPYERSQMDLPRRLCRPPSVPVSALYDHEMLLTLFL